MTAEQELAPWRHAAALLRFAQIPDGEAFVALLKDPDVDLWSTVANLCKFVQLAFVAVGQDPVVFVEQLHRTLLVGAIDPAAFLAELRAQGEGG